MRTGWKLSPSDFAFLWEECKRCFYLKVVKGFRRPSMPMPRIFNVIDGEMKECFKGRHTSKFLSNLPPGRIDFSDKWVESTPISFPRRKSSCFIRGRLDSVIRCDDGTFAVIDFKTSRAKADHIQRYSRQLHAYAYALEKARPGKLALSPITRLGLVVFEPDGFSDGKGHKATLSGELTWIEIHRDDKSFRRFLGQVLAILGRPTPPQADPSCEWCNYRGKGRLTGL